MPPKKKPAKKGKGDDEEEKMKNLGKILSNEIKTMQQRIGIFASIFFFTLRKEKS